MIGLLALRNLTVKPWRALLLLFGFSTGVAVMIVLLSIGEALLDQAKDEKLVGGGAITVLPEGVDVEVLKTGGLGGLFFSIDHARFIHRQLLASPRLADVVTSVSPQIEGKLLYLRTADGRERPVRASADIPSLTSAVGAAPLVTAGRWADDTLDRRWRAPTMAEQRHDIDHFHQPPASAANDPSWAEWHYFNVLSPDRRRWVFASFLVAGTGGQVLVTVHEQGHPERRFTSTAPPSAIRWSTHDADLAIGESRVTVRPDGQYAVHAVAREEKGGAPLTLDLLVAPAPGAYFPGAELTNGVVSGYVVPALRADASGAVCVSGACSPFDRAQSYHDHNWGSWHGVSWEWGAARAGPYTFLYGSIEPPSPDSTVAAPPVFVYVVDSSGFLALFRPRTIRYVDARTTVVDGRAIRTPSTANMEDARGGDTLRISLAIEDASATDTRAPAARALRRPYFVQMKGTATIGGRIRGVPLAGAGAGFFESYR